MADEKLVVVVGIEPQFKAGPLMLSSVRSDVHGPLEFHSVGLSFTALGQRCTVPWARLSVSGWEPTTAPKTKG